ncbi:hypothetical protein QEZ54_17780 [Catellatospora sp. KI3]|uniref:hypothetical protein n=1 Tax=Catellatospora sp. KI3 TaxID=3041620 RepID=UPI002482D782|nr:hypothetical protein [Catellatospora sp. KI3]MDI1462830.1 hypothetical protein [Catellatospora sp. KI3]
MPYRGQVRHPDQPEQSMRIRAAVLALAVLVGLAACSSTSDGDKAGVPPKTYDTAAALIDDIRAAGIACAGYEMIAVEDYDVRARESAFCRTPDEFELNVSVYASGEDAKSSVQRIFDRPAQSTYGSNGVVGANWSVMGPAEGRAWLVKVRDALGGELIEIPAVP